MHSLRLKLTALLGMLALLGCMSAEARVILVPMVMEPVYPVYVEYGPPVIWYHHHHHHHCHGYWVY